MYNKKYLGIMTVLFALGLMLLFTMFWGCDSDSTGSTIVQGDLNDPVFTAIRADLDDMVDSILHNIHNPLTNPWGFPLDSSTLEDPDDDIWWGPLNPEDSADYDYSEDGWHTMYVIHLTASGSEIYYDSMAFFVGGHPWEGFVQGVDEIKYRGSYALDNSGEDQDIVMEFTTRVDLTDVSSYIASANGTAEVMTVVSYSESSSDISERFDYDVTFEDVELTRDNISNWSTYTDADGQLDISMTYTVETTTGDDVDIDEQDWVVEVVLNGSEAEIVATYGNTQWNFDHSL